MPEFINSFGVSYDPDYLHFFLAITEGVYSGDQGRGEGLLLGIKPVKCDHCGSSDFEARCRQCGALIDDIQTVNDPSEFCPKCGNNDFEEIIS